MLDDLERFEPSTVLKRGRPVRRDPPPFLTLSFLALSVVPNLKITDQGLVDG